MDIFWLGKVQENYQIKTYTLVLCPNREYRDNLTIFQINFVDADSELINCAKRGKKCQKTCENNFENHNDFGCKDIPPVISYEVQ